MPAAIMNDKGSVKGHIGGATKKTLPMTIIEVIATLVAGPNDTSLGLQADDLNTADVA